MVEDESSAYDDVSTQTVEEEINHALAEPTVVGDN